MSRGRVKTVNLLCVIVFLLLAVALTLLALRLRFDYLGTTAVTIDRRVTADGTIFDLRDDENNTLWLRKITSNGNLLAHVRLRRLDQSAGEYSGFSILDVSGDTVWLWKTSYDINNLRVIYESILRCEMYTGDVETVYTRDAQGKTALFSPKIWDGSVYIGDKTEGSVTIWRVPLDSGNPVYYGKIRDNFVSRIYAPYSGGLVGITLDSIVMLYSQDGEPVSTLYSPKEYGAIAGASIGTEGEIYLFTVAESGNTFLRVDLNGEIKTVELPEGIEFLSVSAASESVWAGHNRQFTLISSGGNIIESLSVDPLEAPNLKSAMRLLLDTESALYLLSGAAVTAALILLIRHFILRLKTPLMLKQVLWALPIVAVGMYLINSEVENEVKEMISSRLRRELRLYVEHKLHEMDFTIIEHIDWDSPFEDENYLALREVLSTDNTRRLSTIFDMNIVNWHLEDSYVNWWVFAVDGRRVTAAYCGNVSIGIPYEYAQIKDLSDALTAALEQDGAVLSTAFDERGGMWDLLRYQIRNSEGEIIALLDVSLSHIQTEYYLSQIKSALQHRVLALVFLIILACLAVLFIATRRFVALKQAADALREGEYGYRLRVKGNDEVSDITQTFNDMAERVEYSMSMISETSRSFSRFVPQDLFSILEKKSVLEVNPGDNTEIECSLLCLYTGTFEKYTGGNLFENLSRYYQAVMPAVYSTGGIVERYSEDEMVALFQKLPPVAICAAGRIFEALSSLDDFKYNPAERYTVVIGYHRIRLGMIGHSDRLSAAVVSSFLRKSRLIGSLGERLDCRVLMTGEAYAKCALPEGTGIRFIGDAVIDNETHPLYELFPGGMDAERLKEAKLFGEAVDLYYKSRFSEARSLFIEVIKRTPGDLVAREYLLLSDGLMHTQQEPEPLLSSRGE